MVGQKSPGVIVPACVRRDSRGSLEALEDLEVTSHRVLGFLARGSYHCVGVYRARKLPIESLFARRKSTGE